MDMEVGGQCVFVLQKTLDNPCQNLVQWIDFFQPPFPKSDNTARGRQSYVLLIPQIDRDVGLKMHTNPLICTNYK